MSSPDISLPSDAAYLVQRLRNKGVTLWKEGSALRYRSPKGTLTAEDRWQLTHESAEIVAVLMREASVAVAAAEAYSPGVRRGPLSFTQLGHWLERCKVGGGPVLSVACALLLRGDLSVPLLEESLKRVQQRHEALRTRLVMCGGDRAPLQEVMAKAEVNLEVIGGLPGDWSPKDVEQELRRMTRQVRDYSTGPLFRVSLLRGGVEEHVLVLAMDHIISDLYSLGVLQRELFAVYAQLIDKEDVVLPRVEIQLLEYAAKLNARPTLVLANAGARLGNSSRTYFPDDTHPGSISRRTGWGMVQYRMGADLVAELRTWARRCGTTVVLTVLSAYAALVLRWCNLSETVILVIVDGRMDAGLERTIGYFAFPIYLRVTLSGQCTFRDLVTQVTREYCDACDDADSGYALTRAELKYTRNTIFNWFPAENVRENAHVEVSGLECAHFEFANPALEASDVDQEPCVNFIERGGAIIGQVCYPRSRFSHRTMERFAANIVSFLSMLVRGSPLQVSDARIL